MFLKGLISFARLPLPKITNLQVKEVLEVYYDVHGGLRSLGGQDCLKYQLETDYGYYLLAVYHGEYPVHALHVKLDVLKRLANHGNNSQLDAQVIPAESGYDLLSLNLAGELMHFCLFKCNKFWFYN